MIIKVLACYENNYHQKLFEKYFETIDIESISIIPSDYVPCSVKMRLKSGDEFYIAKILKHNFESSNIKDVLLYEMEGRTITE